MSTRRFSRRQVAGPAALAMALAAAPVPPALAERTRVNPGINLFSADQDVEMGREAAAEAEKELALLGDPQIRDYVSDVGRRVAKVSIAPDYPYQFQVIDSAEINAFALPGGFIYVNRGVLEAAGDEAELAGVLAHEVGHAAARHGTNQLSKQVMVQMPLALVLGSVARDDGGWKATLAKLGVSAGMSAVFLSYSRKAETQADVLGTQELYDAGYDPGGMARFFEKLQGLRKGEPSRLERFFASHPPPADRETRVAEEARRLGTPPGAPVQKTRAFERMKARLERLPPPREKAGAGAATGGTPKGGPERGGPSGAERQPAPRVPAPSSRLVRYRDPDGVYRISYPRGWEPREGAGSMTVAPPEARAASPGAVTHGLMVQLVGGGRIDRRRLGDALDRQIEGLLRASPYLSEVPKTRHGTVIEGEDAIETTLAGRTDAGDYRYDEQVVVWLRPLVRESSGHDAMLILGFAPEPDARQYRKTFEAMLGSLRFR